MAWSNISVDDEVTDTAVGPVGWALGGGRRCGAGGHQGPAGPGHTNGSGGVLSPAPVLGCGAPADPRCAAPTPVGQQVPGLQV